MTQSERKKKIESLEKRLEKTQIELKSLRDQCDHSDQEPISKKYYFSGSYYDQAYTELTTHCSICGKKISETTINHSWYG